jgi:hypothetical protein
MRLLLLWCLSLSAVVHAESLQGGACQSTAECSSGLTCVRKEANASEGVCCDTPCEGACTTCRPLGEVGTCKLALKGAQGAPRCQPYACDGVSASCPDRCEADDDCDAASFCHQQQCRTRPLGHVGFGCSSVEGVLVLAAVLALLARRRA